MKFFIKTFGCQHNNADSERIEADFRSRGFTKARSYSSANYVIINTCMIRQTAENRVYGLVNNLGAVKRKKITKGEVYKIVITGCMIGLVYRDKTGKYLKLLKKRMPNADEFMPIEEVGFNYQPVRTDKISAWVPISNGCNNFCSFCIVPFTRGREISRPYEDIISECLELKKKGYKNIMLLGQNVNSYGSDLISLKAKVPNFLRFKFSVKKFSVPSFLKDLKPIYVKHLGRHRIPTLFPYLLDEVAKMGFEKVEFISSNPWDFSNELIDVVAKNKNIARTIHLPVQSGDDNVLKRMNRWYTAKEYLLLISKIKDKISKIKFTTDIIVGFCGETDEEFENTVKLCKNVGFSWAYVSVYSERPMAASTKIYKDDVPHSVKDKRWKILDDLINKPHLKKKIK